jgi:hypothetical protein
LVWLTPTGRKGDRSRSSKNVDGAAAGRPVANRDAR